MDNDASTQKLIPSCTVDRRPGEHSSAPEARIIEIISPLPGLLLETASVLEGQDCQVIVHQRATSKCSLRYGPQVGHSELTRVQAQLAELGLVLCRDPDLGSRIVIEAGFTQAPQECPVEVQCADPSRLQPACAIVTAMGLRAEHGLQELGGESLIEFDEAPSLLVCTLRRELAISEGLPVIPRKVEGLANRIRIRLGLAAGVDARALFDVNILCDDPSASARLRRKLLRLGFDRVRSRTVSEADRQFRFEAGPYQGRSELSILFAAVQREIEVADVDPSQYPLHLAQPSTADSTLAPCQIVLPYKRWRQGALRPYGDSCMEALQVSLVADQPFNDALRPLIRRLRDRGPRVSLAPGECTQEFVIEWGLHALQHDSMCRGLREEVLGLIAELGLSEKMILVESILENPDDGRKIIMRLPIGAACDGSFSIRQCINAHLTLVYDRFLMRMNKFDGILNGQNMPRLILIAVIKHGRQSR